MATDLNIKLLGRGLVDRAKQQQRDARTGRLTQETIKADAEKNREQILRDDETPESPLLASDRPIDTNTPPFIRVNRPAATRSPDKAFLVITNLGLLEDDVFNTFQLYITGPDGNTGIIPGRMTFQKFDFRNRTYLFLPLGRTLTDLEASPAFPYIYQTLDSPTFNPVPEGVPRPVNYIEPFYTLRPFRPTRDTPYRVRLGPDGGGGFGSGDRAYNYGALMAGYLDRETYYYDTWFADPGVYPTVEGVVWGRTNPAVISGPPYPPDYPDI